MGCGLVVPEDAERRREHSQAELRDEGLPCCPGRDGSFWVVLPGGVLVEPTWVLLNELHCNAAGMVVWPLPAHGRRVVTIGRNGGGGGGSAPAARGREWVCETNPMSGTVSASAKRTLRARRRAGFAKRTPRMRRRAGFAKRTLRTGRRAGFAKRTLRTGRRGGLRNWTDAA